ncbi:GNAT family N-acetyltransferase [Acinetobacter nosocomialis]|uniref:GNAT family N-acetyltransferase n=1 Tax=Acinetobacter nosocomialis TaxID=106654 RepID=UPI00148F4408|nr:GNAT family N-acetyltransferase [Acinetobacter nosocomialis]
MITVRREKWIDCIDQIMPLCQMVHDLVEKELYGLPLDFDSDLYQESEDLDQFHCLVMRKNGHPIGFHWMVMYQLARFKGKKQAGTDAIFVHPEHRQHSMKLIEFSEQYAKKHGCMTWAIATLDPEYRGTLWERKGFKKAETIFIKVMP